MKYFRFYLVFILAFALLLSLSYSYINNPSYELNSDQWWNNSWYYRFKLDISSTSYERIDWPVEYEVNFTSLISDLGNYEQLNESSIRVFEYSSGELKHEVPYQFDKSDVYDPATNAKGTLVFFMNGTTSADQERTYYVYFDTVERGLKPNLSYSTDLVYNYTEDKFHVNTSFMSFYIDTNRGKNVSGIYQIIGKTYGWENKLFSIVGEDQETVEYLKYSNGANNFTYDFINNFNFTEGPVRLTVEQQGYENIWDSSDQTNEVFVTKKYHFYHNKSWVKIEHEITNIADYSITRNSTRATGLSFDMERAFGSGYDPRGNSTEPFSWSWSKGGGGTYHLGFVNINQTGTTNFFAENDTNMGKIGITLNSTTLGPGENITNTILVHVNDAEADYNQITDLKNRYKDPINITQGQTEFLRAELTPSTNNTIYNRNETVVISLNVSYDPYNITAFANASLDMGTPSTADNEILQLYDDGSGYDQMANDNVFVNTFNLNSTSDLGEWTINFTTYEANSIFLNSTQLNFNVTDIFNVNTFIFNEEGLVDRVINSTVTVKNYRQDQYIAGAEINCTCPNTTIYSNNITDYNNGTYFVSFNAPSVVDTYTLNCSASKVGNEGWGIDTFIAEPSSTYGNITVSPTNYTSTNITIYDTESFTFSSNLTNIGIGKMRHTNITLDLPSGWQSNSTLENCSLMEPSESCLRDFEIEIPTHTIPGDYEIYVNGTWENPDGSISSNYTTFNAIVASNPKIDITQTSVSGNIGDGLNEIVGNFTVFSWGNDNITDINFSSSGFSSNFSFNFIPENISTLGMLDSFNVSINASVQIDTSPGVYSGLIFAASSNDGEDSTTLELTVVNKTYMNIEVDPTSESVSGISLDNASFEFTSIVDNTGIAIGRSVNVTLSLPSGWQSNSTFENCYSLSPSETCSESFNVTIPKGESPGDYYVYSNVSWENPDGSISTNQTYVLVTIQTDPVMEIVEQSIFSNVSDGVSQLIGNFTIKSTGNEDLFNINFGTLNLTEFNVSYTPSSISSLPIGTNQTIQVNVSVPVTYPTGIYNGTINVTSSNYGSETLGLDLFVLENRTWNMTPTVCQKVTVPYEGTACEITVTNLGNTNINFTVSPSEGNKTEITTTEFSIERNQTEIFNVTYNVTSNPNLIYYSLFLVDAVQPDSEPGSKTLNVSLIPLTEPDVFTSFSPEKTEQGGSVLILTNITDKTLTGLEYVKANVTDPDNITHNFSMSLRNEVGNLSTWELTFPNTTGNTSLRGTYFVQTDVKDNLGNIGGDNGTFAVHTKLFDSISTYTDEYYQGDSGSIYYTLRNSTGSGLSDANVTFELKDPNENITYRETGVTSTSGVVFPLPTFTLSSDTTVGTYTLLANASYYDEVADVYAYSQTNTSFDVIPKVITVSGLFADLETTVVWYPDNVMRFGVLVYDGEGKPVDPDYMNLTVYDPAENEYFTIGKSSMTRETSGYYSYQYAMPASTATGMYLAHLNITDGEFETQKLKAFRVASGGPYDVRVNLPKMEVYQGDYLDFEALIENKGEVSQDVFIEYWVSAENETYYSASEAVYTPSLSNQSFMRNAYIFTNQPLGNYMLNLKVNYDNTQPPIIANKSFTVVSRPVNVTTTTIRRVTGGGGGTTQQEPESIIEEWAKPTEEKKSSISIVDYRSEVELAQSWNTSVTVTVENTGETLLRDVNMVLLGIPLTWYEIRPASLTELKQGNVSAFLIEFMIPEDAGLGEYDVSLTVISNETRDKRMMKLNVYSSVENLLKKKIDDLNLEYEKLSTEIEVARKTGKDVSDILPFLEEIEVQMRLSEQSLANKKYDDAVKSISNAENLVERTRVVLYGQILLKEKGLSLLYVIPVLFVVIVVITVVSYLLYRKKKKEKPLFPALEKVKGSLKVPKKHDEHLLREREKLERMLKLIEKEKKEKIISEGVYKELKSNVHKKMEGIDKKLK